MYQLITRIIFYWLFSFLYIIGWCVCDRRADVTRDSSDCEIKLEGEGPWIAADDITIIHTPVGLIFI